MKSQRNAFGTLIVPLNQAPFDDRVGEIPKVIGQLRARNPSLSSATWLADALEKWINGSVAELTDALGLRPRPGARSAAYCYRIHCRDWKLMTFARQCGSRTAALNVLRGIDPCPAAAQAIYEDLQQYAPLPTSHDTFLRASYRIRRMFIDVADFLASTPHL